MTRSYHHHRLPALIIGAAIVGTMLAATPAAAESVLGRARQTWFPHLQSQTLLSEDAPRAKQQDLGQEPAQERPDAATRAEENAPAGGRGRGGGTTQSSGFTRY